MSCLNNGYITPTLYAIVHDFIILLYEAACVSQSVEVLQYMPCQWSDINSMSGVKADKI